jgi:hypothetical protein
VYSIPALSIVMIVPASPRNSAVASFKALDTISPLLRTVPLLSFRLASEAVADTWNGEDKAPVFRCRFDLLPQLGYVDVQAVRPVVCVYAPYLLEELLACEYLCSFAPLIAACRTCYSGMRPGGHTCFVDWRRFATTAVQPV